MPPAPSISVESHPAARMGWLELERMVRGPGVRVKRR